MYDKVYLISKGLCLQMVESHFLFYTFASTYSMSIEDDLALRKFLPLQ